MEMAIRNFFHNLSQGPPNPGFMQEKVQKGDFLKKDSRELKFFSCFSTVDLFASDPFTIMLSKGGFLWKL